MAHPRMLNDALAGRGADEPFPIPQRTQLPSGNLRDKKLAQLKSQEALLQEMPEQPGAEKFRKMGSAPRRLPGRAMRVAPRGLGLPSVLLKMGGELLSRRGPGAVPDVSDAQKLHEKRYGERRYMYDPFEYVDRTSRAFGEWYSGQHGGGGPPIANTRGDIHLPGGPSRARERDSSAADLRRESEGRYFNRKKGQWEYAEPVGRGLSDSFYAAHGMQTGPRAQKLRKEREQIADALHDKERQKQQERNMRYLAVGNERQKQHERNMRYLVGNEP
jgi:hypothetical protein